MPTAATIAAGMRKHQGWHYDETESDQYSRTYIHFWLESLLKMSSTVMVRLGKGS